MSRIIRRSAAALAASCIVLAPLTSTAQIPGFSQVDDAINTVGNLLDATERAGGSSGLSSSSSAPKPSPENQEGTSKEQLLVNAEYQNRYIRGPQQATLNGTAYSQSFIAFSNVPGSIKLTGNYSNISGTLGFDDHTDAHANYAVLEVLENGKLVREISFDRDEVVEFSHNFAKGTEVELKFHGYEVDHSAAFQTGITLATPTVR